MKYETCMSEDVCRDDRAYGAELLPSCMLSYSEFSLSKKPTCLSCVITLPPTLTPSYSDSLLL